MGELLEKAKLARGKKGYRPPTEDEIEIALAWLAGEVDTTQCVLAFDKRPANDSSLVVYRMAIALRVAYENGRIKIN